ncbi:glutamine synthetase [Shimia sp. R9_1]|uniref:glutamine synthetase family protein n=1 Tax=unclassified Shimia TaxID=2630038 RepID=UPI001ADC6990|nr:MULTISPECIES: glutamine synthetase family protein [unclassified Shimia]MBO9400574.1 glutamine synthetase [Shimia sp. R9_3]MBO9406127.1 glutamine synthetase [Shimia sp. R9_1]
MSGNLTLDELRGLSASGEIDTVLACIVDMQGRLMGKRFVAQHFVDSAWEETHCCNYLLATDLEMHTVEGYAATSWAAGYGDYLMKPDLSTLRRAAWLDGTALVICDVMDHHGHHDIAHSPRAMLKKQIARLAEMGFEAVSATELEFFIFEQSFEELGKTGYRDLTPISAYNEDYHILQTTKEEGVMRALRNGLYASGIPVEGSKGEAETGQEELNIRYGSAMDAAENHTISKHAAKEIGWQQGHAVSFLPKWHHDKVGSASHVHQSLWTKGGVPAFYDADKDLGMSDLARNYLGGLLKYANDITVFLAPYVNSYKRFQKGSFAPTAKVWSVDNRTAAFRLCGDGSKAVRVECRVPGADMNPYLAIAALLAAGIKGIEEKLDPGTPLTGDAYEAGNNVIPTNLRDATEALRGSDMLREAMGSEVVDHYVRMAEWEQEAFDAVVTDWEIARGFERA